MSCFRIVIPARYASTRLPGKALLPIAGRSMLQHVYERAVACDPHSVLIATDDQRIFDEAKSFGADVVMTRKDHPTGTDRVAEAVSKMRYAADDILVGLQGDEPCIPPENLHQIAKVLADAKDCVMATLCEPLHGAEQFNNPNVVKVLVDDNFKARAFSRKLGDELVASQCYRHIGLYAYYVDFLATYVSLDKSPDEIAQSLEQLRVLWHGYAIKLALAEKPTPPGVDTQADLDHVRELMGA